MSNEKQELAIPFKKAGLLHWALVGRAPDSTRAFQKAVVKIASVGLAAGACVYGAARVMSGKPPTMD